MNKEILKKLGEFKKISPAITKESTNPFFKSSYATLNDIQTKIKPALIKTGLFITQSLEQTGLITTLYDLDGNYETFCYPMPKYETQSSQELGSAITYARRYALGAILDLIINDPSDDDGNATSKPKETIFLSNTQYLEYIENANAELLNTILNAKTTKNGNPFRMKTNHREALTQKLSQLETSNAIELTY
jgi:ERF superfamily